MKKRVLLVLTFALMTIVRAFAWQEFPYIEFFTNEYMGTLLTIDEINNHSTVSFGVNADGDRVAVDDPGTLITVSGTYVDSRGLSNAVITVLPWGSVDIYMEETHTSSTIITVTNSDGDIVVSDTTDNSGTTDTLYSYRGPATTLIITGMEYCSHFEFRYRFNAQFSNTGDATGLSSFLECGYHYGDTLRLPRNFTMYKEGYTLTGWSDGTNTYDFGTEFVMSNNLSFTAVYTANTVSLEDRNGTVGVTFDFQRSSGAPIVDFTEALEYDTWVGQANVNGSTIDVKMEIFAPEGRFYTGGPSDWCQVDEHTLFKVPVVQDAYVDLYVYQQGNNPVCFNDIPGWYEHNVYSFTAKEEGTMNVLVMDQMYCKKLVVTYPGPGTILHVTEPTTLILREGDVLSSPALSIGEYSWHYNTEFAGYTGEFYNLYHHNFYISANVKDANFVEVFTTVSEEPYGAYTIKVGHNKQDTIASQLGDVVSSGLIPISTPLEKTTVTIAGVDTNEYVVLAILMKFYPAAMPLGPNGYSTYAAPFKFSVSGAKVYSAVFNATNSAVLLTEIENAVVPAGTGVILKGEEGDSVRIIPTDAEASVFPLNELVGVLDPMTAPVGAYVLTTNNGVTTFNPCHYDLVIPANKAYLMLPWDPVGSPIRIEFAEDTATDNNSLKDSENVQKFFENGQVRILRGGVVYDTTGRIVR